MMMLCIKDKVYIELDVCDDATLLLLLYSMIFTLLYKL